MLRAIVSQFSRRVPRSSGTTNVCIPRVGRTPFVRVLAYKEEGPSCGGFRNLATLNARNNEALVSEKMFCYQCEQTTHGTGCTEVGVCGKTPEVAALQDLLVYSLKGLCYLAHHARQQGVQVPAETNKFVNSAMFSTLTNVNFDDSRFHEFVTECFQHEQKLKSLIQAAGKVIPSVPDSNYDSATEDMPHPLSYNLLDQGVRFNVATLIETGHKVGIAERKRKIGDTLAGLQELLVYGLKGTCAYAHHADAMGFNDEKVYAFVQEALSFLASPDNRDLAKVLDMCFRCGECNFRVLELLSNAHISTYGKPTPTLVNLFPVPGKSILVTGHDMVDLEHLLKQTEGKGVNVYTHGEMLPGHGYPGLKKYPHLVGHFGGAWYKQKIDFSNFPGSILVTTNCVLDPLQNYKDNLYTTNEVGVAASQHIRNKDFTPIIERALQLPGFTQADCDVAPQKVVTVGFGHHAVLGVADQVIDAIKTKKLEHIFLVGGCDGSEPQRKYYAKLYQYMPQNTMVLTLGCGKFRIFDQDFGMLPGTQLPRLLDMGQCNDSYSAIVVATELAKAFNTDVNSLPLSLDLSWFEQKAVAVLLTLLHLGVRNIRLGPKIPAFLTADAVQVLVNKFNLIPADVANPENDLKSMMGCK